MEIAIIPHTWQSTNLRALRDGDPVNIEVDVLAKYAEKMAHGKTQGKLKLRTYQTGLLASLKTKDQHARFDRADLSVKRKGGSVRF